MTCPQCGKQTSSYVRSQALLVCSDCYYENLDLLDVQQSVSPAEEACDAAWECLNA